ncbi:MAG: hypothetical protein ACOYT4_00570 [Nanoarchaeota archaeon]
MVNCRNENSERCNERKQKFTSFRDNDKYTLVVNCKFPEECKSLCPVYDVYVNDSLYLSRVSFEFLSPVKETIIGTIHDDRMGRLHKVFEYYNQHGLVDGEYPQKNEPFVPGVDFDDY